jgi:hypothetical protein
VLPPNSGRPKAHAEETGFTSSKYAMWGVLTKRGLEELKGRVAALEGEKISTETVEETVDKSFLTRRGGANGPWGRAV